MSRVAIFPQRHSRPVEACGADLRCEEAPKFDNCFFPGPRQPGTAAEATSQSEKLSLHMDVSQTSHAASRCAPDLHMEKPDNICGSCKTAVEFWILKGRVRITWGRCRLDQHRNGTARIHQNQCLQSGSAKRAYDAGASSGRNQL